MQNSEPASQTGSLIDQHTQFFKLPQLDQDDVIKNLHTYCCGDSSRIDTRMAKTAFTATVNAPGCAICGKPDVKQSEQGDILLVPYKSAPLHEVEMLPVAVEFLRSQVQSFNQTFAQTA